MIYCSKCGYPVKIIGQCRTCRRARRLLIHACDYLRPSAIGDTQKGIAPNSEALAISTMAQCLVAVIRGTNGQ